MIYRTEYAADLLRQYRLTAGTEMYVEPHYDGTRVSYLQPVGGGQILPPPPIQSSKDFRAVFGNTYIYNPKTQEYFEIPGTTNFYNFYGIRGNYVVGYSGTGFPNFDFFGEVWNGQSLYRVIVGDYTTFYGTDGINAVGETFDLSEPLVPTRGLIYNLSTGLSSTIIYPPLRIPLGTYRTQNCFLGGIDNNIIVGEATLVNTDFQQFKKYFYIKNFSDFVDLDFAPWKVYGDYITNASLLSGQTTAFLYKISTGQKQEIFYNGRATRLTGIYKNIVYGYTAGAPFVEFLYDIISGEFTDVEYGFAQDIG
jgi:hypothetical protein